MLRKHLVRPFEIKAVEDDGTVKGYGSVFDVVDWYNEVVVKGAFAKWLAKWEPAGKPLPMLWQHLSREPIGVWTKFREDDHGLWAEGKLTLEVERAREARALMRDGAVRGLSIGFDVPDDGYSYDSNAGVFLLKEIELWELSPVTFPANEEAQVESVKAARAGGPKHVERLLREAGFSRSEAKGFMARGFEGLRDLREAEGVTPEVVEAVKFLSQFTKKES
jgi:HK97 family phage prohead protease